MCRLVGCRFARLVFVELELSSSRKPSLEPGLQTVGDAVGGPDAMGLRIKWASLKDTLAASSAHFKPTP